MQGANRVHHLKCTNLELVLASEHGTVLHLDIQLPVCLHDCLVVCEGVLLHLAHLQGADTSGTRALGNCRPHVGLADGRLHQMSRLAPSEDCS